jgi:NSS family neurotransmitter:Na+ symporter
MARAHWSSRLAFILAAAGSAIGLGNIWKFPYITGVNGGGAFVLVYLACIAAVGLPILIAELYIGQKSQANAVTAFESLHKKGTNWRYVGFMGVIATILILSFYSVVGGWILDYAAKSLTNKFGGAPESEIESMLGALFGSPSIMLFWHLVFMSATVGIVMNGLNQGIEKWNKILMPALLSILVLLLIQAVMLEGFGEAVSFLFAVDASKLTAGGLREAVGHSFFTLSLGLGTMITYGSYLDKKENLFRTALMVAVMDTLIALLAGVVIFSIVFSFGLEPGAGPALMFKTLPVLFAKLPGGYFLSLGFFVLVAFAALTSSVSLLETAVAYWVETHKADRKKTTVLAGIAIYGLGVLCALSFNVLSAEVIGFSFFDVFDMLTSQLMLPLGGLLTSLYFGWVLGPKAVATAVAKGKVNDIAAQGLLWTVRVVAPLGVFVLLISELKKWF